MACLLSRASLRRPFMPYFCSHLSTSNHSLHTNPDFTNYYLSVLPFCRKSRDLEALKSLLIVRGLISHQPLVKHFIDQCCHLGFPNLALSAFKTIEKPSLYLQNLVLRSLSYDGLFEDVMYFYQTCRDSGFSSDNYTYPFVIKACAALCDVWFGRMMHCVVLKSGFGENLVVQTALLDFYSKVGEMGNARKLVDEISQPDVVAWNALISGYSVNRFDFEVLQVLQDMHTMSVKPNSSTFASVFPVCSRVGVDDVGTSVHGLAYKLGYTEEESLVPALISMYANSGNLLAARHIFDTSTRNNIAIWNAITSAYTRNHRPEDAVPVLQAMLRNDIKPNMVTFVSLLPSSENLGCIYVESFHAYLVKFGFEEELSVVTALLSVYAKLGNMDSAEFLFHNIRVRNLLFWNSTVSAYAGHGLCEQSLEAFCLMQKDGFVPDAISIVSLLSSCSEMSATLLGKSSWLKLFHIGDKTSISLWNTVISANLLSKDGSMAFSFFRELLRNKIEPDDVTVLNLISACVHLKNLHISNSVLGYLSVLSACSHGGFVEQSRKIFDSMIHEDGVYPGLEHYACMVDLVGRTGRLNEAYELVKNLPHKPSSNILGSLLGACLSHGNYQLGEEIGRLLLDMNPKDSGSYVILHNIYAAAGKWVDANNVRLAMEQKQFSKSPGVSILDGI